MWRENTIYAGIAGAAVAVWFVVGTAALAQDLYHVRGRLAARAGGTLVIDTREGPTKFVSLGDEAALFVVDNATIADIVPGKFIGITSIEARGKRIALEVHIFDDSLRGLAEGHYPWDLVSEANMMTNATVASVVGFGQEDRELRVTYSEGEEGSKTEGVQTIVVPQDAVIVDFNVATDEMLTVGKNLFLLVTDTDTGTVAPALVIGAEGIVPPM